MATLINLLGGPSVGKSSTAFGLMYLMKIRGYTVEYIPEVAKGIVWRKEYHLLDNQRYLVEEAHTLISQINDSVDYIVLDGPISLSLYYNRHYKPENYSQELDQFILEKHNEFKTVNVFLKRDDSIKYEQAGRFQNEKEAKDIDLKMLDIFKKNNIDITEVQVRKLTEDMTGSHISDILNLL